MKVFIGSTVLEWQVAKRKYSTSKVSSCGHEEIPHVQGRGSGQEELPHIQGQEQWLRFAGAAVKRYPKSKVRETQVRQ